MVPNQGDLLPRGHLAFLGTFLIVTAFGRDVGCRHPGPSYSTQGQPPSPRKERRCHWAKAGILVLWAGIESVRGSDNTPEQVSLCSVCGNQRGLLRGQETKPNSNKLRQNRELTGCSNYIYGWNLEGPQNSWCPHPNAVQMEHMSADENSGPHSLPHASSS